jgi:hypothetical protein
MQAVEVHVLADGDLEHWPAGPVNLAIGQGILGPGSLIDVPTDESIVLAIETGTVIINSDESRTVSAFSGVMQSAGSVREIRNADDGLVILLILTITPAAD